MMNITHNERENLCDVINTLVNEAIFKNCNTDIIICPTSAAHGMSVQSVRLKFSECEVVK